MGNEWLYELMDMTQDAMMEHENGNFAACYHKLEELESGIDFLINRADAVIIPGKLFNTLLKLANAEVIFCDDEEDAERKVEEFKRKKINKNNRKEI